VTVPVQSENERRNPFWRDRAECRTYEPEIFFPRPSSGVGAEYDPKVRFARDICAACDVQRECAIEALNGEWRHGVWAGVYLSPSTAAETRDAARQKLRGIAGVAS
jgi:hypothetical protein